MCRRALVSVKCAGSRQQSSRVAEGRHKVMNNLERQRGFALPSILMLVTLLTLVALSVLLLQHIRYLQAVTEVARVKADFAAQSGVARAAAEQSFREQGNLLRFADSSSAFVRTLPWGLMKLAVVQGASGRIKSARMALLGAAPPPEYKSAICFGGASRQLIMTASTQIERCCGRSAKGLTVWGQDD